MADAARCYRLIPAATGLLTSALIVVLVVMTTWSPVHGYPKGAPFSTCLTMFPKHSHHQRQLQGPVPFLIDLSPASYRPGQVITVRVRSTDGQRPMKGLQVKATRRTGDSESALGSFIKHPVNITKVFTCEGGYKNMISHNTGMASSPVGEVTVGWKAPEINVGDIVFVATFVESFDVFWTGVKVTLRAREMTQLPVSELPPVTDAQFDNLDLDSCGSDKGCFLYPRTCSGSNCFAAASYRQDGDHFLFELIAQRSTYVSLGISDDVHMGQDETITCTAEDDQVFLSVQHGFNPALYNQRIVRHQLSGLTVNRTDGNIMCTFRRPRVAVTRFVNQSAPELQYVSSTYDLDHDYYLMLAWGTVKLGSDVINKHKELPPVTDSKVSFRTYAVHRGSALPIEARIHGSLMAVAWVFVAGLTTGMSRYYKHWLSDRAACGTGIWFQIHRAAGITTGVLTISSITLIVVFVGGFAKKELEHAIVGLTIVSFTALQIVGGIFRPVRTSDFRPYFRWVHTILGHSAHIMAAVAMYLAFNIRYVPEVMRDFGVAVLTGWVPVQVAWIIVLELRRCCTVDQDIRKEKQLLSRALTSPDSLLLFFYGLTLFLLAVAILSAIHVF